MIRIIAFLLIPLAAQATLLKIHAPVEKKNAAKPLQLNAEQQQHMHFGCLEACKPSPVESKCVTACEAASYKCIDETGPNENEEDTKKCQDKVLKLYKETKGIEKKEEKKEEKKGEAKKEEKKEEKKAKMFLQVKNIDDDNAEAAEMARLEDQSDKDLGEDDSEGATSGDDENDADDDEEKSESDYQESMEKLKTAQEKLSDSLIDLKADLTEAEKTLVEKKEELKTTTAAKEAIAKLQDHKVDTVKKAAKEALPKIGKADLVKE